jgi:hypothetical protein
MLGGAGAQWYGGGGLFYNPGSGVTAGGFKSGGAFAGIGPWNVTAVASPNPCEHAREFGAVGSSLGVGSGLWFSDAGSPTDLGGPFDQFNLNTPLFSASLAWSGDTWIFSLTSSGGAKYGGGGLSFSYYPTSTYSAGGFNLMTGQPVVYQP